MLGPVLKRQASDDDAGQTRLDSYYLAYHDNTRFATIRSKRLSVAVRGRTGQPASSEAKEGKTKKRRTTPSKKKGEKNQKSKIPKKSRSKKKKSVNSLDTNDAENGVSNEQRNQASVPSSPSVRRNPKRLKRPISLVEANCSGAESSEGELGSPQMSSTFEESSDCDSCDAEAE